MNATPCRAALTAWPIPLPWGKLPANLRQSGSVSYVITPTYKHAPEYPSGVDHPSSGPPSAEPDLPPGP